MKNYLQKLGKALADAKKSLFYFEELYDRDFKSSGMISRIEMANAISQMDLSEFSNNRKLKAHRTSGSSGIPLIVYFTSWEFIKKDIDFLLMYIQHGYNPFRWIVALRDPIDIKEPNILQKLGFARHFYLNVFLSYEHNVNKLINKFRGKSVYLKGHASDVWALVRYSDLIRENKVKIKMIISDSEVLESFMFEDLERVFNCRVLDTYSSVETGLIAVKNCKKDDTFKVVGNVLVDIEPGEMGFNRIILTKLGNPFMPFVRYEIGDYTFDPPAKGVKELKSIVGKYISILEHYNGSPVSGHLIKQEISNNFSDIARFQVIQAVDKSVNIRVHFKDQLVNSKIDNLKAIEEKILECLGPVNIEVTEFDLFNGRKSRKFQVIERQRQIL
jgi:phenylacetate-coenzyme A ligase PaaK-like adenylate-forming protein